MTDSNGPILIHLPILPLKRTVLFPGTMMPLTVGRERSIAAVEAALKTEDKTLLVVAQRDAQTDQPTLEDLYSIGTKAVIKQTARTQEGHYNILIQGLERFVLLKIDQTDPYLQARVKQLPAPAERSTEVEALHRAILDIIHGLGLSDGSEFGAPGFVRLNFGTRRALLDEALARLARATSDGMEPDRPAVWRPA